MSREKNITLEGLKIKVFKQVYEPAEDTFLILKNLREHVKDKKVLDVGCGCGILGVYSLVYGAKEVIFTDISKYAVTNAKANTMHNNVYDRSHIINCNLVDPIVLNKVDVILFNPPYLPVKREINEPIELAWCGGEDGREVIDKFLDTVLRYKLDNKVILMVHSSLSNVKKTIDRFLKGGFKVRVIERIHMFFEDIILLEVRTNGNERCKSSSCRT